MGSIEDFTGKYKLTAQELAIKLDSSEAYVSELARQGKIPGVKLMNKWRFCEDEVLACLRKKSEEVIERNSSSDSGDTEASSFLQ